MFLPSKLTCINFSCSNIIYDFALQVVFDTNEPIY